MVNSDLRTSEFSIFHWRIICSLISEMSEEIKKYIYLLTINAVAFTKSYLQGAAEKFHEVVTLQSLIH